MTLKLGSDLRVGDTIMVRGTFGNPPRPHQVEQIVDQGEYLEILWDDGVTSPVVPDQRLDVEQ